MIDMLEYKQQWRGGLLVKINPRFTSQTCFECKHIAKENRQTQARFECVKCTYVANADVNAARNILAAGHAVLSVEGGCNELPTTLAVGAFYAVFAKKRFTLIRGPLFHGPHSV